MEMTCATVREVLPAYVRDGDGSLSVRRHLSRCTECRTDLTHYEDLLGALSSMEAATADPPFALRASLIDIPSRSSRLENVRSHVTENRKAYASGAAVLVAGVLGAAVWKSRKPVTA
ncbi:MAG: hypothetical protein QOG04_1852 [Actinomycetota bacterium]|jgi:anti-sigma factor RsiW|nr:hypothetical protein [Actinomycetota bacterium]